MNTAPVNPISATSQFTATKPNAPVVGDAQARSIIRECIAESMSCRSDIEDANSELDALLESHANLLKALAGLMSVAGFAIAAFKGETTRLIGVEEMEALVTKARAAIEDATGVL